MGLRAARAARRAGSAPKNSFSRPGSRSSQCRSAGLAVQSLRALAALAPSARSACAGARRSRGARSGSPRAASRVRLGVELRVGDREEVARPRPPAICLRSYGVASPAEVEQPQHHVRGRSRVRPALRPAHRPPDRSDMVRVHFHLVRVGRFMRSPNGGGQVMVLQAEPTRSAPRSAHDWHRIFESLPQEHDYVVDDVEGRLPAGPDRHPLPQRPRHQRGRWQAVRPPLRRRTE